MSCITLKLASPRQRNTQHNTATSLGIGALPVELLRKIFLLVRGQTTMTLGKPKTYRKQYEWLPLTAVCAHWRAVLEQCSPLWSTILVPAIDKTALLSRFLRNAGDSPLTVAHDCSGEDSDPSPALLRLVLKELGRIERLWLDSIHSVCPDVLHALSQPAPMLRECTIYVHKDLRWMYPSFEVPFGADNMPRLQDLTVVGRFGDPWRQLSSMTSLRSLNFGGGDSVLLSQLLDCLSHLRLESLAVGTCQLVIDVDPKAAPIELSSLKSFAFSDQFPEDICRFLQSANTHRDMDISIDYGLRYSAQPVTSILSKARANRTTDSDWDPSSIASLYVAHREEAVIAGGRRLLPINTNWSNYPAIPGRVFRLQSLCLLDDSEDINYALRTFPIRRVRQLWLDSYTSRHKHAPEAYWDSVAHLSALLPDIPQVHLVCAPVTTCELGGIGEAIDVLRTPIDNPGRPPFAWSRVTDLSIHVHFGPTAHETMRLRGVLRRRAENGCARLTKLFFVVRAPCVTDLGLLAECADEVGYAI